MNPIPLRVLMVSNDPSLFQEGSATRRRLQTYASHLEALHVLSRGFSGTITEGALTLHGAGHSRLLSKFFLARHAIRIVRAYSIQVISAQDPFEHGQAALRACRATGARLHIQIHTDFLSPHFAAESSLNRMRVRIADTVLPEAAGIRVVSERIKRSLVHRYGPRIITPEVLPIAVSSEAVSAATLPTDMPPFRLIAVSRLEKEKRLEDVLAAVARVRGRYPSVGLAIVGDGKERKRLERKARALGIKNAVWFLGAREDARGLMKSATAFIQASAYEGYGLTLIEAALARVPIITTDVGVVGDVLIAEESALVCPVGDIECLERQIVRLVEDNALRTSLAMQAESVAARETGKTVDMPREMMAQLARVAETTST